MTQMREANSNSQIGQSWGFSPEDISDGDGGLAHRNSRNGKWWYSTFHNVTASVGTGVLGLPTVMVYLGWVGGIVVLVMSFVITLFTMWQMVEMYEIEGEQPEQRSKTYQELGQKAFGTKGFWLILAQQLFAFVVVDILYIVTGGQSLWLFYQLLYCPGDLDFTVLGNGDECCGQIGRTTFTLFFAVPQFLLAQADGFNSIAFMSIAASVMSVGFSTVAWVESLRQGFSNHSKYSSAPSSQAMMNCTTDYNFPANSSPTNAVFGVFTALGVVAFAYNGHNVALEIQETMPYSEEEPSRKVPMWKGVVRAYVIVAICYFPVAIVGYWAFGNHLAAKSRRGNPFSGNILLQLGEDSKQKVLIATANMMVYVHVTGSYLVYAMPAFDLMERLYEEFRFVDKIENIFVKFRFQKPTRKGSKRMIRMVTRSLYVLFTAGVACSIPFFEDLLAVFGGFALTPNTYFLPCMIWLKIKKPKAFTTEWFINWLCIIIGVLITVIATIGGLRNIIVDYSKTGSPYQFRCTYNATKSNLPLACSRLYFNSTNLFYGI